MAPTGVAVVARSFEAFGSKMPMLTTAALLNVPSRGAMTRTVSARLAPLVKPKEGHVTTPAACTPPLLTSRNVPPTGSESMTATAAAALGPAFDVVST